MSWFWFIIFFMAGWMIRGVIDGFLLEKMVSELIKILNKKGILKWY